MVEPTNSKASPAKVGGERVGFRGRRGHVGLGGRDGQDGRAPRKPVREIGREAAVFRGDGLERGGVSDRRVYLGPVSDDPGIGEESGSIGLAVAGDDLGVEAAEGSSEGLSLSQDRGPRQTGLEALQGEPLEELAVAGRRHAPLGVVIGEHQRVGAVVAAGPPAARWVGAIHRGRVGGAPAAQASGSKPSESPSAKSFSAGHATSSKVAATMSGGTVGLPRVSSTVQQ